MRVALDAALHARARLAGAPARLPDPDGQRARWAQLAARTAAVHEALGGGEPVAGPWRDYVAALERDLLPVPPADFLRHPIVRQTMAVRGPRLLWRERRALARAGLLDGLADDVAGDPVLVLARPPVSATLVHHATHLLRFAQVAGRPLAECGPVVEVGGGFGSLARLLQRTPQPPAHVILDLPIVGALAWTYLATVLGEDRVRIGFDGAAAPEPGTVTIAPVAAAALVAPYAGVTVALWSLSETTAADQAAVRATGLLDAPHLLVAGERTSDRFDSTPLLDDLAAGGARVVPTARDGSVYLIR